MGRPKLEVELGGGAEVGVLEPRYVEVGVAVQGTQAASVRRQKMDRGESSQDVKKQAQWKGAANEGRMDNVGRGEVRELERKVDFFPLSRGREGGGGASGGGEEEPGVTMPAPEPAPVQLAVEC